MYQDNRQTIPEVYNYAGNYNTGGYVQTVQPAQSAQPQPINEYRTSNVQSVNVQRTSNVQPITTSQPVTTNVQKTSQFKGSRAQQVFASDNRYNTYQNINQYKYNLFSLIDEPWNRCLQVGKCGSCPGNQCIAKQSRRGTWNWN